jgi:hypothetical protein
MGARRVGHGYRCDNRRRNKTNVSNSARAETGGRLPDVDEDAAHVLARWSAPPFGTLAGSAPSAKNDPSSRLGAGFGSNRLPAVSTIQGRYADNSV